MELNEQEAHCVARLLQSAFCGDEIYVGCDYCKFRCEHVLAKSDAIRKRLTEETGVDLTMKDCGRLPQSNFQHGKYLKNANEDVKKIYRERFKLLSKICDI